MRARYLDSLLSCTSLKLTNEQALESRQGQTWNTTILFPKLGPVRDDFSFVHGQAGEPALDTEMPSLCLFPGAPPLHPVPTPAASQGHDLVKSSYLDTARPWRRFPNRILIRVPVPGHSSVSRMKDIGRDGSRFTRFVIICLVVAFCHGELQMALRNGHSRHHCWDIAT